MLALIGRILLFARDYRSRIYVALVFSFVGTILKSVPIGAAAFLISMLLDGTLTQVDCAIAAVALLICLVAQAACQYGADRLQSSAGYELFAEKRLELAEHLRRLPMGYFTSGNIGKISSVLSGDIVFIEENCMKVLADLMNDVFTQIVMTAFLFVLDWQIGLAALVIEAAAVCVGRKIKSVGLVDSVKRQEAIEGMNAQIIEHVEGFAVAKSNALLGKQAQTLRDSFTHMCQTSIRFEKNFTPWARAVYCIFAVGSTLILGLTVARYQVGAIELFAAIALILFVFSLFNPLRHLYGEGASLTIMQAAMDRFEALMAEPELSDRGVDILPEAHETDAPEIEFCDVSFSYGGASAGSSSAGDSPVGSSSAGDSPVGSSSAAGIPSVGSPSAVARPSKHSAPDPIRQPEQRGAEQKGCALSTELKNDAISTEQKGCALSHVSFTVGAGEVIALVGPSGSGKTTAVSLLTRFWDVDSGAIRLRGIDIRDLPLATVSAEVSAVFQRVYLFRGSVAENIRMGRGSATDAEVREAARRARCLEFIERLPYGFNTKVGEGGTSLSGGEAQRISLARAILKGAPIVVLDEATASVDADNEEAIQAAISELCRNKTLIVIAHRLNTVVGANQILVLENGRIVERGNHAELMAMGKSGHYYRMFSAFEGRVSRSEHESGSAPACAERKVDEHE